MMGMCWAVGGWVCEACILFESLWTPGIFK